MKLSVSYFLVDGMCLGLGQLFVPSVGLTTGEEKVGTIESTI